MKFQIAFRKMEKKLNQASKGGAKSKLLLAIQRLKQGGTVDEWMQVDNKIKSQIQSFIEMRLEFKPEFTDNNFKIILNRSGFTYTDNRTQDSTIVFTQRILKKKCVLGRHTLYIDKKNKWSSRDCFIAIMALLDYAQFPPQTTIFFDIDQFTYNLMVYYQNTSFPIVSNFYKNKYIVHISEK